MAKFNFLFFACERHIIKKYFQKKSYLKMKNQTTIFKQG